MANLVFAGAGHVFPPIVRQFNMLRPARPNYAAEIGGSAGLHVSDWDNADYFKDWLPYNLQVFGGADVDTGSFGAFTTAPDGTTDTARKLIESATTSEHSFIAGVAGLGLKSCGKLRLSGVFKYAGRRVVLSICRVITGFYFYGCKATFDILNGEVAIDTAAFGGATWGIYPAQIRAVGNGWYQCSIEANDRETFLGSMQAIFSKVSFDNSSEPAVESISYAGDGVAGAYAWRSSMLPARAWDLGEVVLFDDFDSMDTIDINNTKLEINPATGQPYKWYVSNPWPGYDAGHPDHPEHDTPAPGTITVSDSAVLCSTHVRILGSATSTWYRPPEIFPPPNPVRNYTHGYVGSTYSRPGLFETRLKLTNSSSTALAFWGVTIDWLLSERFGDTATWVEGMEIDWHELFNNSLGVAHVAFKPVTDTQEEHNEVGAGANTYTNIDIWRAAVMYSPGVSVEHLGSLYTCINAETTNQPPDVTPTRWTAYVHNQSGAIPPTAHLEQYQTYSSMCFPWTSEEPGQIYIFFNGGFASVPFIYGPGLTGDANKDSFHHTDSKEMVLFFGGTLAANATFDWVKVTQ